jgi:hypothetical protein
MDLSKFFTPIYERVRSPFISTFLISWSVCNWDIIYTTIFVDASTLGIPKNEYIRQFYFDYSAANASTTLLKHYLFPLILTLFYLTAFQSILSWAFEVNEKVKGKRKSKKFEIHNEIPVSREEFLGLMDELENQKNKYKNIQKDKGALITEISDKEDKILEIEKSKNSSESAYKTTIQDKLDTIALLNAQLENKEKEKSLKGIFEGNWRLDYAKNMEEPNLTKQLRGSENVIINADSNRYFADGHEDFELRSISVDLKERRLSLVKFGINRKNTILYTELSMNTNSKFQGFEWESGISQPQIHRVTYTRE